MNVLCYLKLAWRAHCLRESWLIEWAATVDRRKEYIGTTPRRRGSVVNLAEDSSVIRDRSSAECVEQRLRSRLRGVERIVSSINWWMGE